MRDEVGRTGLGGKDEGGRMKDELWRRRREGKSGQRDVETMRERMNYEG
jgi:hypothetical protein